MKKVVALLGKGEVGSAIEKIAIETDYKVLARDLKADGFNGEEVLCLHVCIPYKKETFMDAIKKAARDVRPELVIIHSTIPLGTTKRVYKEVGIPVAHSPIRGDHPALYQGIKNNFVKYVAGVNKNATDLAIRHLKSLGIKKVKDAKDPINTELGKLVNTFAYAWSIILCKWVERLSQETGADFDIVYSDFIETYNQGYRRKSPNVLQPILKPTAGPIGGHCLIPNTKLLKRVDNYGFTDFILKENRRYKK